MAIVVEGFDNSGKSTLAKQFGLDILHPGPRPKNSAELTACLEAQLPQARLPVVLDRITAISNIMYDPRSLHLCNPAFYWDYLSQMIATPGFVIIYCRPPIEKIADFSTHEIKSYDDQKRIDWLSQNYKYIVERYDGWMSSLPHMVYDYTQPDPNVIEAAFNMQFTPGLWRKWREQIGI